MFIALIVKNLYINIINFRSNSNKVNKVNKTE